MVCTENDTKHEAARTWGGTWGSASPHAGNSARIAGPWEIGGRAIAKSKIPGQRAARFWRETDSAGRIDGAAVSANGEPVCARNEDSAKTAK
jgi:hypothetical protein